MLIDLVHNLALLLALIVAYDLIAGRLFAGRLPERLISGVLFGGVAIIGMMTPVEPAAGLIYDGRTIVIGVAGFVGGPVIAGVASIAAGAYRVWVGGIGTLPGILSILSALLIGSAGYLLRRRESRWERPIFVALVGFAIHVGMLAAQFLLPRGFYADVLFALVPVILIVYPVVFTVTVQVVLAWQGREQARRDVAESEQKYRSLFENSSSPMLLIDPGDAGILDANERAASFYGWTREELCRMTVSDINTMSEEEIAREMERARRESRTYFEMQHRLRDGSVRDVAVFSGSVVIGGEERLFSVVRDLTEQKQAAKELYVLRYATENSAWGVFRIRESDGRILYANRFARETLGYTADEITELTVFEIDPNFTPEGWAAHRRDVREAVGTTIETSHRRKDGSEFPVEMTNTFISYEDEVFFFAFARDISARKRAEERLHASLREKEVLLREVHHRVKNNLAVIAGLIRLQLHEAEPDDASAEALSKTRDRITVMSLMHNMLYHEQNVARVDMADLVARIANQLQDFYDPHFRISVAYDLADAAVELGDALPIGLITNEVLTNALIHAFPGGDAAAGPETPRISVRLRTDGSAANTGTGERSPAAAGNPGTGRPTAELTIADNGRGLPEDFDPERRNSLGFRMIFLLAEQVGGEIRIDRSDGTRVTLAVPL